VSDHSAIGPGLYVATADGNSLTRLLPDSVAGPAWTPDGLHLTYAFPLPGGRRVALCLAGADGMPLRDLYEGYLAASGPAASVAQWSRSQRHVGFVIEDPADTFHFKLLVGDAAGKSFNVVVGPGNTRAYSWLHGSSRIAFAGENGIGSVAWDGTLPAVVDPRHTTNFGLLQLSPDGQRLAFVDQGHDLDVVNIDGTDFRRLWSSVAGEIQGFSWSPDGTALVLNGNDGQTGLFTIGVDGSGFNRIGTGYNFYPTWAPTGPAIAFSESFPSPQGENLRLIGPDGSDSRTLATTAAGHSIVISGGWAPDGQRLLFSVARREVSGPSLSVPS
jgi:Tol biopolymer transport system component